ncbi:helix-turn-helix domain-containing protein [Streptomyces sp. NPDC096310]|uniref:helix-turn-helix domain-containing protein n=1 Tax=Streptomyces sp. NPDC096310 TaxID=3366082 RepID=UPI003820A3C2
MATAPQHIGTRIAARRQARRMSQTDLSRVSGVSLSMIRGIERGVRSPGAATLDRLATALGTDPDRLLTADPPRVSERVRAALPRMSAAIAGYDIGTDKATATRALPELATAVSAAETRRLGAQYSGLAADVPRLLTDLLVTVHTVRMDRQRAVRLLARAARSADAVAYKAGAHDVSARLIDVMRWASEQAEDPLLAASAAYVRTEVFFAARSYGLGLRALEAAIDDCGPPVDAPNAAALGALHMRAAVVAGRSGDADAAETHLTEARAMALRVPEGIYSGTAFGPGSLRIHEVSVAVALDGDHTARVVEIAHGWKPPVGMTSERRSGFYIEVARAQVRSGRRADAFASLQVARSIAPQHTRAHPWAREDTATLRRLARGER